MADRYLEKMALLKIMETSEKLQIARYTSLTARVSRDPAFSGLVFSASLIALTLPLLSSSLRPPCVADADIIFLPCGFLWPSSGIGQAIILVHGQVTIIIFVVSVCLSVCLFVCLFVHSFSQPSSIRFGSN